MDLETRRHGVSRIALGINSANAPSQSQGGLTFTTLLTVDKTLAILFALLHLHHPDNLHDDNGKLGVEDCVDKNIFVKTFASP